MGDEVEDRLVVPHDEVNGQWELRGSIKRNKLGDMGHGTFSAHVIGALL
jgi:hypothetical protein